MADTTNPAPAQAAPVEKRMTAKGLGAGTSGAPAGQGNQLVRWMFVYSLPGGDMKHVAAATGPASRPEAIRLFRQNHPGMGIHEAVPNASPAQIDAKAAEIVAEDPNHVAITDVADMLPKAPES